jgi:hypothetical protein
LDSQPIVLISSNEDRLGSQARDPTRRCFPNSRRTTRDQSNSTIKNSFFPILIPFVDCPSRAFVPIIACSENSSVNLCTTKIAAVLAGSLVDRHSKDRESAQLTEEQ